MPSEKTGEYEKADVALTARSTTSNAYKTNRRTLRAGDAFVQRVDFSQYSIAFTVDLGALDCG